MLGYTQEFEDRHCWVQLLQVKVIKSGVCLFFNDQGKIDHLFYAVTLFTQLTLPPKLERPIF